MRHCIAVHQHVISTALKACREVVLLTYCDPEIPGYEPALRQRWLDELYPKALRLVVTKEKSGSLVPE